MERIYDVIVRPLVTEKSTYLAVNKVYTFEVIKDSNKIEIKNAIEKLFNVNVEKVNIINQRPRKKRIGLYQGRTKNFKKAIIKLTKESPQINIFDEE